MFDNVKQRVKTGVGWTICYNNISVSKKKEKLGLKSYWCLLKKCFMQFFFWYNAPFLPHLQKKKRKKEMTTNYSYNV